MTSVIYLTDTRYGQRGWQHPSARHRCYHYADALIANGVKSAVVPLDRVTPGLLSGYDHAVFHRPQYSRRFEKAYQACGQSSVRIHADFDDLVFSPEYASSSPLYINGGRRLQQVEQQFQSTGKAAARFESFICSTKVLKTRLEHHFPSATVTVLPNSLPRLFRRPSFRSDNIRPHVVGYFPGSRGHEADFGVLRNTMSRLINSNLRLLIVGRWNSQASDNIPGVVHVPFNDYSQYLNLLAQVDVSIAPLENNIFNDSKSAVKLIESVSVGTPIVASAIPDMIDHDNDLTTLVENPDQWKQAILSALAKLDNHSAIAIHAEKLARRFSVNSRLEILNKHFGWTDEWAIEQH